MSAICTIFDSLMSPPNAYHDDHLSKGRAVGEWTVHRAACLPCPQLLAHMHCVHLTLQHFRKKSIFNFSWPPAFNPLSSALGCVAYPMGGVRASPSSRARAEWSPDNEKMVSKAVVYPMADTKQLYASCARTFPEIQHEYITSGFVDRDAHCSSPSIEYTYMHCKHP
jgi:hypothetical protein